MDSPITYSMSDLGIEGPGFSEVAFAGPFPLCNPETVAAICAELKGLTKDTVSCRSFSNRVAPKQIRGLAPR